MKSFTYHVPKIGTVRVRRNGAAYVATLGEWQICGCAWTLAYGLIFSLISTMIDSVITN